MSVPSAVAVATPHCEPPSVQELDARLSRVRDRMRREGVDWLVVFSPPNVFYLTDFWNYVHERPFLLLVGPDGPPVFVAPALEHLHVQRRSRLPMEIVSYREFPAPEGERWQDRVHEILPAAARIGVESALPLGLHEHIPGSRVVTDIVDELRFVKSDYEIGRLAYASQIVSDAHALVFEQARTGATNGELSAVAGRITQRILTDNPDVNALAVSSLAMIWSAALSSDPHNVPSLTEPLVAGGPQVTIVTANANGYAAELERTFFIERVPEAARDPFDASMEARALAFELLRPGAVLGEIDAAVNRLLHARGYGDRLLHRTGHGLGVTGHEAPFLAEGDGCVTEPGMVLSIEPGIYITGLGGFRHSDTVLVTEQGAVSLTSAPESLDDLVLA